MPSYKATKISNSLKSNFILIFIFIKLIVSRKCQQNTKEENVKVQQICSHQPTEKCYKQLFRRKAGSASSVVIKYSFDTNQQFGLGVIHRMKILKFHFFRLLEVVFTAGTVRQWWPRLIFHKYSWSYIHRRFLNHKFKN